MEVLGEVNDTFENSVHEIVEESETDAVDLRRLEEGESYVKDLTSQVLSQS